MHDQERPTVAGPAKPDLRALLAEDHARLDDLFDEVVAAFRSGDRDRATALWKAFAGGLEAHMTLEEERILPEFAQVDPAEAAALAREHAEIRTSLDELGIGVDLHCTTAPAVERLVRSVEDHARREEALMYRWSGASLREDVQASIRAKLRAAARKLGAHRSRRDSKLGTRRST